jgi:hypothetical protein
VAGQKVRERELMRALGKREVFPEEKPFFDRGCLSLTFWAILFDWFLDVNDSLKAHVEFMEGHFGVRDDQLKTARQQCARRILRVAVED